MVSKTPTGVCAPAFILYKKFNYGNNYNNYDAAHR